MIRQSPTIAFAASMGLAFALPAAAQTAPATAAADTDKLETVVITAQKRSESVQDAALAVTAVSAATLEKARILTSEDLAHSQVGLTFTQNSPQALEINIRGVVNTRLTAPTADQSVSIFTDEVYVSRSGSISSNFYDLERIEVIRGPQGVLLGKNVAGGALSIVSASPSFVNSAAATFTAGNYDLKQVSGYVTGGLTDEWAGRLSFQSIDHGGYAQDLIHNVGLEDLHSQQVRGQLLYAPKDSSFRGSWVFEYAKDSSTGPNRVGFASPNGLPGPKFNPWSNARALIKANFLPTLNIRQSFPTWPTFAGDATPTPQAVRHENFSGIMKLEADVSPNVLFTSITGVRHGHADTFYDQSGIGPSNPYNIDVFALFAEPVFFQETVDQYSQELRLTSKDSGSRFDWIVGAYGQQIKVHQFNRFWGESKYLANLSGQSYWDDPGKSEDYAVFAQGGFKFTDMWKLDVGVRYTHDQKSGVQTGTAVSLDSKFDVGNRVPLTPLLVTTSFTAPYEKSWTKVTPQATLTFKPNESVMAYFTASEGYKGGGFQNNAPNAVAAAKPYNPESVRNYELGLKWEFFDGRARWNTALFYEKYTDLQVQQTDGGCLCNIIANAKAAEIKGVETEFQMEPVHSFYFFVNGSYLKDKYTQFIDPVNGTNYAGRTLQRTPNYQVAVGGELTTNLGSMADALHFRLSYKQQGKMFWAQDNFNTERAFGLLDGRVSFAPRDSKWSVSVWGKNMTDRVYRTNIIAILGDEVGSYGAPKTFGVDVAARF
jgi:iron complex outermembrane receptor protein